MSRFTKARKLVEGHAERFPYMATACASVSPLTADRIGQCFSAVTDRGVRTFAFRRERERDIFVETVVTAVCK